VSSQAEQELAIVQSVHKDFEQWRQQRRSLETRWILNNKFVQGHQFCEVDFRGEVVDTDVDYSWQQRQVYNHIAPIVETRLAKLGRVRPQMSVRPSSDDEKDIRTAKVASKMLASSCDRIKLDESITDATVQSEIMGSAFYKLSWDSTLGKKVGTVGNKTVTNGDVRIDVCSPFEIFVDNLYARSIEEVQSIIHAKSIHIEDIKLLWGKLPNKIVSTSVTNQLGLSQISSDSGDSNYCLVLERHTRPTVDKPNGELVIVAGDTLMYCGDLPYRIGREGEVDLPFVEQRAISIPDSFYGISVVERCIPIQRAYNAVKNRKHEFINRLASGVIAVEDGSVDIDNLEEHGLAPGKILSFRQGSVPPQILDAGRVPPEFNYEEDRLLSEFITVSGVSEIMRNSSLPTSVSSGVAISLLIEQDDTRLSLTAQSIRNAIRKLAQMVIRMYKQYASVVRLERIIGDNGEVELMSFNSSDLTSDDVVFDTENELSKTPASKQQMLFELLRTGLLQDENGRINDSTRYKLLDALGYGGWERSKSLDGLHIKRAEAENLEILNKKLQVEEIDYHTLHIETHTAYLLSGDNLESKKKNLLLEHIKEHRRVLDLEKQLQLQTQPSN